MKVFLLIVILFSPGFAKEIFILTLHSYHESYPWTKEQDTGFRDVIDAIPELYPLYSVEYLDTKRRAFDKEYEDEVLHYMRSKYKGYHPDIIYVTDDNALKFMLDKKEILFPGVPVVFSGINNVSVVDTLPKKFYTGVLEEKEIIPNLRLLQQLFPDEHDVLLVGDGSLTSKAIQAKIEQESSLIAKMNIRYLHNDSLDAVVNKLKAYKGKNIILTTIGGFHSRSGSLVPLDEAIGNIVHAGDFYIFSLEKNFIQQGVIGGHADDGVLQGREAGKMALKMIMNSDAPLPKILKGGHGWFFDIHSLKQHNITLPDAIAEKSTFFNQPDTFYQQHEKFITNFIYLLLLTVMSGSLLFIWYLFRSRRIIAEREKNLVSVTDSLKNAQRLTHIGNWVWNINEGTLWWSDEIYRIFGLDPQEFKATYEAFLERVHPDDREAVASAVNHTLASKENYKIVHRIIRMDGTIRRVLEEGSIEYEDGKPVKMDGTVHDITEEYEREEALLLQAQIFDAVQDSVIVHDLEGKFLYLNENAWKTRGYTYDEMMKMSLKDLEASEFTNEKMKAAIAQMKEQGHMVIRVEHLCKNGDRLPVEVYAKLINLKNKPYILCSVRDIREQLAAQEKITQLSKVVEQIDDSVMMTDKQGKITYVNQAFTEHTGFSREEVLGNNPKVLKSGQYDQRFYRDMWKIILHGDVFRITIANRKKNGDLFYENKTITPLKDSDDNITGFVSSGKDVTLEMMMHQDMERIATIDKLTGIYNRHKFEELFALESERSRRFSQPLSLILIDIDHFKAVNDTYGHDIGDEVLKQLVKIVQDNIRQIDIFARWGGEEFLVLSPSTDFENIQILAEKLRLAVSKSEFPKISHITISEGVSTFRKDDSFSELFKRADQGLYYAKEHGRNQVGVMKIKDIP